MVDTYKMMNQIRTVNVKNADDNELVAMWNKNEDATVIAELFCRHFGMFNRIATKPKFAYIDNSDKVSFVLQGLYNAIIKFDESKNIRFITFASNCVYMSLVSEIVKQHSKGKWQSRNNISIDELVDKCNDGENFEYYYDIYFEDNTIDNLMYDIIQSYGFTERQVQLCMAIMHDYKMSDIEIAEELGVHRHTVRTEKIKIRNKLQALYNY